MIDVFNLPGNTDGTQQIFYPINAINDTENYQVWVKPKGCTFVQVFVLGGGGGGAGGVSGTAAVNNGGGGGASGNISSGLFPAALLPDELYAFVGRGGVRGNANGNGAAGLASYVLFTKSPTIVTANTLLISNGGGGGTTAAGGTVGGASTSTAAFLSYLGIPIFYQGQAGVATNLSITVSNLITGGAGGGGTSSVGPTSTSGGDITGIISGGASGAANPGRRGVGNIARRDGSTEYRMLFTGGSGGGGNFAGIGGEGGAGNYGSGGGGGGAGTTGGIGGRGGDGLIIITSW